MYLLVFIDDIFVSRVCVAHDFCVIDSVVNSSDRRPLLATVSFPPH